MSFLKLGLSLLVSSSVLMAGTVITSRVQASPFVAPVSVSGLQSVSTASVTVSGTATMVGTVTLTGPAPVGGAKVALKGSSRSETLPAGVVVPEGSSSATFNILSTGVAKNTLITIKATHNAISKETTYTRTPQN